MEGVQFQTSGSGRLEAWFQDEPPAQVAPGAALPTPLTVIYNPGYCPDRTNIWVEIPVWAELLLVRAEVPGKSPARQESLDIPSIRAVPDTLIDSAIPGETPASPNVSAPSDIPIDPAPLGEMPPSPSVSAPGDIPIDLAPIEPMLLDQTPPSPGVPASPGIPIDHAIDGEVPRSPSVPAASDSPVDPAPLGEKPPSPSVPAPSGKSIDPAFLGGKLPSPPSSATPPNTSPTTPRATTTTPDRENLPSLREALASVNPIFGPTRPPPDRVDDDALGLDGGPKIAAGTATMLWDDHLHMWRTQLDFKWDGVTIPDVKEGRYVFWVRICSGKGKMADFGLESRVFEVVRAEDLRERCLLRKLWCED
ncbi:hypothetical protein B0T16DRAFT_417669 [Cercophora newfieldiana]|uniref:Uncharacterized protein n=1 Tax=Cercophora newfieldiana TaxID=92897 RepID=A0AA40CN12_9PEZI|nr:hypothetical protein B0T16DRAFT_417669 [Cercophora newfieldiana]